MDINNFYFDIQNSNFMFKIYQFLKMALTFFYFKLQNLNFPFQLNQLVFTITISKVIQLIKFKLPVSEKNIFENGY